MWTGKRFNTTEFWWRFSQPYVSQISWNSTISADPSGNCGLPSILTLITDPLCCGEEGSGKKEKKLFFFSLLGREMNVKCRDKRSSSSHLWWHIDSGWIDEIHFGKDRRWWDERPGLINNMGSLQGSGGLGKTARGWREILKDADVCTPYLIQFSFNGIVFFQPNVLYFYHKVASSF